MVSSTLQLLLQNTPIHVTFKKFKKKNNITTKTCTYILFLGLIFQSSPETDLTSILQIYESLN